MDEGIWTSQTVAHTSTVATMQRAVLYSGACNGKQHVWSSSGVQHQWQAASIPITCPATWKHGMRFLLCVQADSSRQQAGNKGQLSIAVLAYCSSRVQAAVCTHGYCQNSLYAMAACNTTCRSAEGAAAVVAAHSSSSV